MFKYLGVLPWGGINTYVYAYKQYCIRCPQYTIVVNGWTSNKMIKEEVTDWYGYCINCLDHLPVVKQVLAKFLSNPIELLESET